MITEWQLYWITRGDDVNLVCFVLMFMFAFSIVFSFATDSQENLSILLIGLILSASIGALTPNTKELALIYVLPKIASSEEVKDFGGRFGKLSDMAFDKLEEILESGVDVKK